MGGIGIDEIANALAQFNDVAQTPLAREVIFNTGAGAFLALERILPKAVGDVIQKHWPSLVKEKPEKSPDQLLRDAKKELLIRVAIPALTMPFMMGFRVLDPNDAVFHASLIYLGYGIAESINKVRKASVENQLAVEP